MGKQKLLNFCGYSPQLRIKTGFGVIETSLKVLAVGQPLNVSLDSLNGLPVASGCRSSIRVPGKEVNQLQWGSKITL